MDFALGSRLMSLGFFSRSRLLLYFATTFLISWGSILLILGGFAGFSGTDAKTDQRFPYVYLAMLAGPAVSAILWTAVLDGREGLRAIGRRMFAWRIALRWYVLAIAIAPLVTVIARFLVFGSGGPGSLDAVAFGLVVGVGAGILEELGWTGFATLPLRRRFGVLTSGLILGVIWAAWHVLAVVWGIGAVAGNVPLALFITLDLLSALPVYRVLMVWLHDRTGSLMLSMLMHASLTSSLLILGPAGEAGASMLRYDLLIAVMLWGLVALFVGAAQGRSLRRIHVRPTA